MYAINPELCTFCKSCMEECPTGAIQEGAVDGKEVCVVSSECIDCGGCEDSCPTDPKAIGYNIGFHQERENTGVPATARPIFVSPNNKTTGEGIEHATLQNDHCGG